MAFTDIFKNWRTDPFTGDTYEADLEEVHQILEFESTPGIYGIISHEAPYFSGEIGNITAVQVANKAGDPLSGGTIYNEVTFSTVPASDEFRVDYSDDTVDTFYSTARFNFNSSEDGNWIKINYKGTGSIVKGRYQLNQVSTVSTNFYVEGNIEATDNITADIDINAGNDIIGGNDLKIDNDIYIQADSLFNLNWLDSALDKQFFDDSSSQVGYFSAGTDNKKCLRFIANSTDIDSEYKINGQITWIRMPEWGTFNMLFRAKENGSLSGGSMRFRLLAYDKDKVFISVHSFEILNSYFTTSWKWYNGAIDSLPANTVYVRFSIRMTNSTTAGKLDIDWIYGGDISIPIGVISNIMSGSTVGHYKPADQYGFSNIVLLDNPQIITLTATPTYYALTDSERFKNKLKGVLVSSYWDGNGASAFARVVVYVGSNIRDLMKSDLASVNYEHRCDTICSISSFSSGQAMLRLYKLPSASTIVKVWIWAFLLK